jgi:hypothetical protein
MRGSLVRRRNEKIHVTVRTHFFARSRAKKVHLFDGFATKNGPERVSNLGCCFRAHLNPNFKIAHPAINPRLYTFEMALAERFRCR